MKTFGLFVCVAMLSISGCCSSKIDLSSLHMIPDLYKLCWRQSEDKKIDYLRIDKRQRAPVSEEKDDRNNTRYCVQNMEDTEYHSVEFPVTEDAADGYFALTVRFSLPLSPAFQIIRKKIVRQGLHLRLLNDYAGIPGNASSDCVVILEYLKSESRQTTYEVVQMSTNLKSEYFVSADDESPFTIAYSCVVQSFIQISSAFIIEKGVIFPKYDIDAIRPLVKYPFRRFLVAQWRHTSTVPCYYLLAVYEEKEASKCLKIFRFFKSSFENCSSSEKSFIPLEHCGPETPIEDVGFYDDTGNGDVYVVLDMFIPLKINVLYKFFMRWISHQHIENRRNFVYFESWPNENCGLINPEIIKGSPKNFDFYTNLTSDIRQNVICQYRRTPYNESSLSVITNTSVSVFPSLSSTKPYYEFFGLLNYSNVKRKMNDFCSRTFTPFCYFMLYDNSNRKIELLEVQKSEDNTTKIRAVNFTTEIGDPMFTVSLDLHSGSLSQAMFIVEVYDTAKKCDSVYILTCKTCNQQLKQLSKERFGNAIDQSKEKCRQRVKVLESHYEAADKRISFQINDMPYEQNFYLKTYSVNLFGVTDSFQSTPAFLKKSLFQKYGIIIFAILISPIILLCCVFCCRKKPAEQRTIETQHGPARRSVQREPDEQIEQTVLMTQISPPQQTAPDKDTTQKATNDC